MNYVYLDNAATTKPNEVALKNAIELLNNDGFYNPSALYNPSRAVKTQIEKVRLQVLKLFPNGYDLVFTSGGTEADNLAIFSFAKKGNIVTTSGEHSAVYNTFQQLKQTGIEVRFAKLNSDGSVNEEHLLSLIDEKTSFVSVVNVNNETGAINDINSIAMRVKSINKNVIFHSDGVQAFLKINQKLSQNVDLYSISAHKIGALKGTGALIYKKNLHLKAQLFGGGQEHNYRSGTENTFGIFNFGFAICENANIEQNFKNAQVLKDAFLNELQGVVQLVSSTNSSPYIVSISLVGIKAEIMQRLLADEGYLVGTGSACSSKLGTSRIISNCNLDKRVSEGVLRISFGFTTTIDEVIGCANAIKKCAERLKVIKKWKKLL